MAEIKKLDVEKLLPAIESAEWRGREKDNHWKRTFYAPKEGSTAFGPYQITKRLVQSALENGLLSESSSRFAQDVLLPIQAKFSQFGKMPHLKGYDKEFDYGGSGYFDSDLHGESYKQLTKELLLHEVDRQNSDLLSTLEAWRGKSYKQDPEYFDIAMRRYNEDSLY